MVSPAAYRGLWSAQWGEAGLPLTPEGTTLDAPLEVAEVVDGPDRRDHGRAVAEQWVESALGHRLIVAAERERSTQ